MPRIYFEHDYAGELTIDNGLDHADWSYGVNFATFPTYGGEVVQILSVYIDDLTLGGTLATYRQAESIYTYFATYFQAATQGKAQPTSGDLTTGSSYNLQPVYFYYPERQWSFKLYPMGAPGFVYDRDNAVRTWQVKCHVIDDSPDLGLIKNGIQALTVSQLVGGEGSATANTFTINGNISPEFGNPDTDPFETYNQGKTALQAQVQNYADYYNSLLPAYSAGTFDSLTGITASKPGFGNTLPSGPNATITNPTGTSSTQAGSTTGAGNPQTKTPAP
jgi:hypothetical protein